MGEAEVDKTFADNASTSYIFIRLSFSLFEIDSVLFSRSIYSIIIITTNIKHNQYGLMFGVIS